MPVKIKKRMLKKRRKRNDLFEKQKNKIIIVILLMITILFGIFVGVSFAKYQQSVQGQVLAKIAKPILTVKKDKDLLLTALAPKASYVFEIKNYQEEQLNEVEMEYYIEIMSHTDESIQFALYQEEEQIPLVKNKTENRKLTKDKKETHCYRLEVTYDKTKGDTKKDINEKVEIKIHAIQKT